MVNAYFLYQKSREEVIIIAEYVITDGTRYIVKDRKNKYVPRSNMSLADIFNKKQAENICKNQLPGALRKIFYVEKIDVPPKQVKQVCESDIRDTEKVMISENIQKWMDKILDLNGLSQDATKRKEQLTIELSNVDKELCDLYHYVEFCNLNASEGYKAYKMIKDRRIKRRSIKNELDVLNIILGKKIKESIMDEIINSVKGLDKRTYEPRVMKELFDI